MRRNAFGQLIPSNVRFFTDPPEGGGGNDDFKAPASQQEFDRMVKDRLERERAKFAGYDELKSKAERLDQIETAQKTELEKAADRIAEAEAKTAAAEKAAAEHSTELLRLQVAAEKGITGEDLKLLTGSSKDDLNAKADLILKLRRGARRDPGQGKSSDDEKPGRAGLAEAERRFGGKK